MIMKIDFIPVAAIQEKVTALTPAHKALIFLGTLLLLGGAFYFLQYREQASQIAKLESKVDGLTKQIATLKLAAAQLAITEQEVAKADEEFNQLLTFLPNQKEIPGLLENVSQKGSEVGLENVLFQPQPEQPHEFYAAIPIRLELQGTYHDLGRFFDEISKLDRILKVDNLSMTRNKDTSAIQATCVVSTYRFLDKPVQPAKKPAPAGKAPPKK